MTSYCTASSPQVFRHHWNRTGYHVVRSEREYGTYLATSEFCLAPPGAGHGQRQIQVRGKTGPRGTGSVITP